MCREGSRPLLDSRKILCVSFASMQTAISWLLLSMSSIRTCSAAKASFAPFASSISQLCFCVCSYISEERGRLGRRLVLTQGSRLRWLRAAVTGMFRVFHREFRLFMGIVSYMGWDGVTHSIDGQLFEGGN